MNTMACVLGIKKIKVLKLFPVQSFKRNQSSNQNGNFPEIKIKEIHKAVGTFGDLTTVEAVDKHFIVESALTEPQYGNQVEPLVIILGWAGATHKNLSKYSQVYRERGCGTLQYILPTRFIFRHTEQVHEAVDDITRYLKKRGLSTPIAIHCLSDTGVMCFQGLSISSVINGFPLHPHGIVWDSCPGPRPHVTIPRGLVLCIINWMSRMRDGMSVGKALTSSYQDFRDLAWRNYLRRMWGLPTKISTMDNVWTGHWARDLRICVPEIFLYSKSDFYTSYKYLESDVIPIRSKIARTVTTRRWDRSPHVGHLRTHRKEYVDEIDKFLKTLSFTN
eukprot:GFUD01035272.1.p1 GENE.GFUD01035272.1~~GFUD01035272.1.p1  ORF type:complete len:333 (-),score=52.26 GFUD01035272.1:207-1205(-)